MGVGKAHGHHRHLHPLALGQLGQACQSLLQPQGLILAVDPAFGEQHQLLTPLQQVHGQPQAGQGGAPLVDRKTSQPMQQPSLRADHLIPGDHEAAVPSGGPAAGPQGKQEGIPAGAVGGSEQQGPLVNQMLATPHHHPRKVGGQGEVLGDHHRQGGQPAAHPVAHAALPGLDQRALAGRGGAQQGSLLLANGVRAASLRGSSCPGRGIWGCGLGLDHHLDHHGERLDLRLETRGRSRYQKDGEGSWPFGRYGAPYSLSPPEADNAMASLGVNLDHIATVRQARRTVEPDPVTYALLAELGGASGITVHLREDRRHIQDRDVTLLRQTVRTRLNLEMAATPAMEAVALELRPDMVTLVPERREEVTTEGGLDVAGQVAPLGGLVERLQAEGIGVSLFVDPQAVQLDACCSTGARWVELHTGRYADARWTEQPGELERLQQAAAMARQLGLRVNAGHGLTYANVEPVAAIDGMEELNIGHSIVARALAVGLAAAVREMGALIQNPRRDPLFGSRQP